MQDNTISRNNTLTWSLAAFFGLAYFIVLSVLIPEVAAERGLLPFHVPTPLLYIAGFSPALAALIVAGARAGREGLRELLGRLFRVRVKPVWYGVALFGPVLILLAALGIEVLIGGMPGFDAVPFRAMLGPNANPWLLLPVLFLVQFIGLIGEELGWRGYALPP